MDRRDSTVAIGYFTASTFPNTRLQCASESSGAVRDERGANNRGEATRTNEPKPNLELYEEQKRLLIAGRAKAMYLFVIRAHGKQGRQMQASIIVLVWIPGMRASIPRRGTARKYSIR